LAVSLRLYSFSFVSYDSIVARRSER